MSISVTLKDSGEVQFGNSTKNTFKVINVPTDRRITITPRDENGRIRIQWESGDHYLSIKSRIEPILYFEYGGHILGVYGYHPNHGHNRIMIPMWDHRGTGWADLTSYFEK